MQHEITTPGPLLDTHGSLAQRGWMRSPLLQYRRTGIKASALRIKEWNYYCILTKDHGIALTVADNGYLGLYAINVFDFTNNTETTGVIIEPFTLGKLNLPESPLNGDTHVKHKKVRMHFEHREGKRILHFNMPGLSKNKGIHGEIVLRERNRDAMVIATPFPQNPNAFYYNYKMNCLAAEGQYTLGDRSYRFDPTNSFGVLDWGRGVWPYSDAWYWGNASGLVNGKPFGFNIGYGFGDTSAASENMLFYDGVAHKLEQVTFLFDKKDFLKPWKFSSSDKRFELDFVPAIDRYSNTNLWLLQSVQHQVFGYFSGTVILDDGASLHLDRLLGFAEYVLNKW